jgi:hypothetical protein
MNVWTSAWRVEYASRSEDCIDEQDEYDVPVHVACSSCCSGPECAEDGVCGRDTFERVAVATLQQSRD